MSGGWFGYRSKKRQLILDALSAREPQSGKDLQAQIQGDIGMHLSVMRLDGLLSMRVCGSQRYYARSELAFKRLDEVEQRHQQEHKEMEPWRQSKRTLAAIRRHLNPPG